MSGPGAAAAPAAARAQPWTAYALLAASMALVGVYVGLSKLLVAVFPVVLLAWLRFGLGALGMLGWWRHGPGDRALSAADHRWLFLKSLFGNVLFSLCMLYGVMWTSALAAGVVMAAIPAAVALLSWWALGERIEARTRMAIVLAVAGIALLAWARAPGDAAQAGQAGPPWRQALGHLLLLGAVFCEAAYVVIGKKLVGHISPKRLAAGINLWGLALTTPVGLWQARRFGFADVGPASWALLVFYALAASVVTVWLWMRGLKQVSAARAGVVTVCLPLAAAATGVLALGESVGPLHAVALALALGGVLLATWPARAEAPA